MGIVNWDVLALVVVGSAILAKVFEIIKARAKHFWSKLTDEQREIAGYGMMIISGTLMWFTNLNMLPGFSVIWPPLGRVLTCIIAGLGPSAVYDMWIDAPGKPPAPDVPPWREHG